MTDLESLESIEVDNSRINLFLTELHALCVHHKLRYLTDGTGQGVIVVWVPERVRYEVTSTGVVTEVAA